MKPIPPAITTIRSVPFEVIKPAIVALAPVDRAYLRRWLIRYVDDRGQVVQPIVRPARSFSRR